MKEPVRRAEHPMLVGVVVAGVAVAFFALMAKSGYKDPPRAHSYREDLSVFTQMEEEVETQFAETGRIEVGDLANAHAMAAGADGTIYVGAENTVAVYDAAGKRLRTHEISGTPVSMAVAPDGVVYLGMYRTDDTSARVVALRPDGSLEAWEELGPRALLTSIAANDANVYVAVHDSSRVVLRYSRSGELLGEIGRKDEDRGVPGLVAPSPYLDLGFDDEGNLWVVNPGRLGLERYRENGDIVTSWYKPGMRLDEFSGCCNPSHIAFTKDGMLLTAEKGLVRLKLYDVTSGEYKELVAGTDAFPKEQSVYDLAVDAKNRVLVLDPRHNAVRIFERTEHSDESATQPA